jgi:hypothetical protein
MCLREYPGGADVALRQCLQPERRAPTPVRLTVVVPRRVLRSLLLLAARDVRCEECGRTLFRGRAFVGRGGVKLLGAEKALVRVDFDSMNRLAFRHGAAGDCQPAAERQ